MKKLAVWVLLSVLLLTLLAGCGSQVTASPETLAFPGTEWNATPEQVTKALGISQKQILAQETIQDDPGVTVMGMLVEDISCFGVPVDEAYFEFVQHHADAALGLSGSESLGLASVSLRFREEGPLNDLRKKLEEAYGPGTPGDLGHYSLEEDGVHHYADPTLNVPGAETQEKFGWTASRKLESCLSPEAAKQVVEAYQRREQPIQEEYVRQWLGQIPVATLSWRDRGDMDTEVAGTVNWSAGWLLWVTQNFG